MRFEIHLLQADNKNKSFTILSVPAPISMGWDKKNILSAEYNRNWAEF